MQIRALFYIPNGHTTLCSPVCFLHYITLCDFRSVFPFTKQLNSPYSTSMIGMIQNILNIAPHCFEALDQSTTLNRNIIIFTTIYTHYRCPSINCVHYYTKYMLCYLQTLLLLCLMFTVVFPCIELLYLMTYIVL